MKIFGKIRRRRWQQGWLRFGLGMLALWCAAVSAADAAPAAGKDEVKQQVQEQPESAGKRVAVVIDDFGNAMQGSQQMLNLPIKITIAVMPFMQTTKSDAEAAHKLGHEVIVHMPMEPNKGKPEWLGPGAITTAMSDAEIRKRVEQAIDDVPHAVGMNNHMGSKVTADPRVMRVVLQVCKERRIFFLDSRTTFKTVVPKLAKELDLPVLGNNVFLDDVYSSGHINKQLRILQTFMNTHSEAITIGHVGAPGKLTSAALAQSIPTLKTHAKFVGLSELLPRSSYEKLILP